jgi:TRAP-type C4-dicarboxylate transport system permease small subunit
VKTIFTLSRGLSQIMFAIAGVALTATMLLTVADVLLRAFRTPIVGTYELVGLMGAIVVGFAIPETSRANGHVIMDMLPGMLSGGWRRLLTVTTRLIGIALFIIIAVNLWSMGHDFRANGEVTPTLQLPLYPVAWGLAICSVVECFILFVEILQTKEPEI